MGNRTVGIVCTCGEFTASPNEVSFCRGCRAILANGAPHAIIRVRASLNAGGVRITPEVTFEGTWSDEARESVRAAIEGVEARRARDAGER